MRFVIKRTKDGAYLHHDPGGTGSTWTTALEHARIFTSREAAERDLCQENESAVPLDHCFDDRQLLMGKVDELRAYYEAVAARRKK